MKLEALGNFALIYDFSRRPTIRPRYSVVKNELRCKLASIVIRFLFIQLRLNPPIRDEPDQRHKDVQPI